MLNQDDSNVTTRWKDLKKYDLRTRARHVALDGLSFLNALLGCHRYLETPRVHFLYFHHIYSDEIENFRKMLAWLNDKGVRFVSYSKAVERLVQPNMSYVYVSLSFDDGLKNCLDASRVMDEFGAKGCFFVNGKVVDNSDKMDVDEFSRTRLNMKPQEYLGWRDLESLVSRGHEIGNHTYSHINCAHVTLSEFHDDFSKNHELLAERIMKPVHFAWPYGGGENIDESLLSVLREAGYKSAASAIRGCHLARCIGDPFFILREHCVAAWPIRHVKYFMMRSVRRAEVRCEAG